MAWHNAWWSIASLETDSHFIWDHQYNMLLQRRLCIDINARVFHSQMVTYRNERNSFKSNELIFVLQHILLYFIVWCTPFCISKQCICGRVLLDQAWPSSSNTQKSYMDITVGYRHISCVNYTRTNLPVRQRRYESRWDWVRRLTRQDQWSIWWPRGMQLVDSHTDSWRENIPRLKRQINKFVNDVSMKKY
jgi:hypothetical protein